MSRSAEVIQKHFVKKKEGSLYSLRALARDMGVSPAFISLLLNGKRKLPLRMLPEISRILDIDFETQALLKKLLEKEKGSWIEDDERRTLKRNWNLANKRNLSALRSWFYLPILEFTSCTGFDGTEQCIASRL